MGERNLDLNFSHKRVLAKLNWLKHDQGRNELCPVGFLTQLDYSKSLRFFKWELCSHFKANYLV